MPNEPVAPVNRNAGELLFLRAQVIDMLGKLRLRDEEITKLKTEVYDATLRDLNHQADIGRGNNQIHDDTDLFNAIRKPLQDAGLMRIEEPHSAIPAHVAALVAKK